MCYLRRDTCEAACRFRANFCRGFIGGAELALDSKIKDARRYAQILQRHAVSFPDIDQAGFCTITWVVSGEQLYFIDNHPGNRTPIHDLRFSESVGDEISRFDNWTSALLRKGDMLYVSSGFLSNATD